MPRIPITEPIFPDAALSESAIKDRLSHHALRLKARKTGLIIPDDFAAEEKLEHLQLHSNHSIGAALAPSADICGA